MCGIISGKEAMELSEKHLAEYRMAEACERAFNKYMLDLVRSGKRDLDDRSVIWAVSGIFYGATSMEELERYSAMTPEELVALDAAREANREDELERQGEQNP